jgi:alpha-glucuronidase
MRIRSFVRSLGWLCFFASVAAAEDGYRLWLRYDLVSDQKIREQYSRQISEIVSSGNSPTCAALREELQTGLSGLLGQAVPVVAKATRDGALVVVIATNSPWQSELRLLGPEGYLIRSVTNENRAATVIVAAGDTGALYGAFHFLRLLQTHQDISHLNISEKPFLQRRILDHWDNLSGSVERGYAGRSLWKWTELPDKVDPRYQDYARANASLGLNGAVLNNVNAAPEQLAAKNLRKAAAIADVLRPYGIRVYLSANFASPKVLGGLKTADPRRPDVQRWWRDKADEIYALIPDFGGFLVKANSEGQPGPQDYHLTHAEGANLLAGALAPHGGVVMWRAFVYNHPNGDADRAKRAFLEFTPLDGKFATNVFVQIKNGPIDFQPREPFHPLFGALKKTSVMAECEITQENLGHSTDLVYLAPMWREFFASQLHAGGKDSSVADALADSPMTGIAGVANTGRDRNWCGYDFAQANWYAFGRLAWNPHLAPDRIAEEWIRMTWGNDPQVLATVSKMMLGSWEACVDYEMPLGLHHLMEGGNHYDPRPETVNRKTPEYSGVYYHKADVNGIGFDRTAAGSDAVGEYAPEVAARLASLETCPPELLLWFHHVGWDYRLQNGRTVWNELCFRYQSGVDYVRQMQIEWQSLQGRIDSQRFDAVNQKLASQLAHATNWRNVCLGYFQSINQKPFPDFLKNEIQPWP